MVWIGRSEVLRTCPICRAAQVPPREANPAFPFCSDRCRLVDLGKWLGEEYRVPDPTPPPSPPSEEEPGRS
jgi:endogenous inhibitor of DNA gyrase (YacG/DUF329 family)